MWICGVTKKMGRIFIKYHVIRKLTPPPNSTDDGRNKYIILFYVFKIFSHFLLHFSPREKDPTFFSEGHVLRQLRYISCFIYYMKLSYLQSFPFWWLKFCNKPFAYHVINLFIYLYTHIHTSSWWSKPTISWLHRSTRRNPFFPSIMIMPILLFHLSFRG